MKFKLKEKKGITLIVLIITIVVLLILAGIGLASLSGESSIINQASKAKDETEYANAKLELELQLEMAKGDDEEGEYNEEILKERFVENLNISESNISKIKNVLVVEYNGYEFYIDKDGHTVDGLIAPLISNEPTKYYGKYVNNYTCENDAAVEKWQIFYADENNIYLIADDYIHYDYMPSGKKGSIINTKSTDYIVTFKDVYLDYNVSDIANSKAKNILSYFSNNENTLTNAGNTRSIAYMLDTDAWNKFQGSKAEYAIGGPTLDLFAASYNQMNPSKQIGYIAGSVGYSLSINGGSYGQTIGGSLGASQSLYFKSTSNGSSMWLASTSNGSGNWMLYADTISNGRIYRERILW